MNERRVTDGGRDLRAYLTATKQTVPDFCDKHGLDRFQVQKVLNGQVWQRVSVDFAYAIEKATGGKVRWTRFLSSTARVAKKAA